MAGSFMEFYRCSICLEFVAPSIKSLLVHIGRVHGNEENFHVTCGVNSCARTYKKFESLRLHFFRKHDLQTQLQNQDDCAAQEFDNASEFRLPGQVYQKRLFLITFLIFLALHF